MIRTFIIFTVLTVFGYAFLGFVIFDLCRQLKSKENKINNQENWIHDRIISYEKLNDMYLSLKDKHLALERAYSDKCSEYKQATQHVSICGVKKPDNVSVETWALFTEIMLNPYISKGDVNYCMDYNISSMDYNVTMSVRHVRRDADIVHYIEARNRMEQEKWRSAKYD